METARARFGCVPLEGEDLETIEISNGGKLFLGEGVLDAVRAAYVDPKMYA